eukprot:m.218603 g.218603  ORF g.218603 m.218603 type:complete len:483 (-) comp33272_c0_seq1:208-1656(-)
MSHSDPELLEPIGSINRLDVHSPPHAVAELKKRRRRAWKSIIGICATFFWIHCQPSESYLTDFLRINKNITEEALDEYVWPVDTYASLVSLFPLGFAAESCGYRTVVVIGLVCREATRVLLLFGNGVPLMAIMQGTYAIATGADTILLALAYLHVEDPADYKRVTVCVFVAKHIGSMLGSGIAQGLVESGIMGSLADLFYISWGFTTLGLICFVLLVSKPQKELPVSMFNLLQTTGVRSTWGVLKHLYHDWVTIYWTIWWVLGYSMSTVISNYYQNQFQNVDEHAKLGAAAIAMEFCSIIGVLVAFACVACLERMTVVVIVTMSTFIGIMYHLTTVSPMSLHIESVGALNAVAFGIAAFELTAASTIIAASTSDPRYSIIFTANTTMSLVFATIVQAIGTAQLWSTDDYFRAAAWIEYSVVPVILFVMVVLRYGCKLQHQDVASYSPTGNTQGRQRQRRRKDRKSRFSIEIETAADATLLEP